MKLYGYKPKFKSTLLFQTAEMLAPNYRKEILNVAFCTISWK